MLQKLLLILSPVLVFFGSSIPVEINDKLPAPEYIRADWVVSDATENYGRVGQRIVFKYSGELEDRIENFRLYEKRPDQDDFHRIAGFEEILSTGCEDIDVDGEWMMTEAGQCEYWAIQRIIPPGERGVAAYLPSSDYLVGEYVYYVAGVDKDGLETPPSGQAKLVFLNPVSILSPFNRETAGPYPDFKWTIAEDWSFDTVPSDAKAVAGRQDKPIVIDYFVMLSDSGNAQNPVWRKQLKIQSGIDRKMITYDGLGLDPVKIYKANIYGRYRHSEYEPDYISISANMPEFWVERKSSGFSVGKIFADLFRLVFGVVF